MQLIRILARKGQRSCCYEPSFAQCSYLFPTGIQDLRIKNNLVWNYYWFHLSRSQMLITVYAYVQLVCPYVLQKMYRWFIYDLFQWFKYTTNNINSTVCGPDRRQGSSFIQLPITHTLFITFALPRHDQSGISNQKCKIRDESQDSHILAYITVGRHHN